MTSAGHAFRISSALFFASSNFTLKISLYLPLHHPQYCVSWNQDKLHMRNESITHHLDWIEFTMELGEEHTQMPLICDGLLKEGSLVLKVFLLAEEAGHAAAFILHWANGGALCPQPSDIEATLLRCLLQSFWFTSFKCHLLGKAPIMRVRISHQDYCIFSFLLFSII